MSTSQLQQENNKLKSEVSNLQKQLNDCQQQIFQLKLELKSPPSQQLNGITPKRRSKTETNINVADLLKDRTQSLIKKPQKNNNDNAIETNINTRDAKNALMAKFAALGKHSQSSSSPDVLKLSAKNINNSALLKKYETMLKIGVDIVGVITQMNKDNMDSKLIDNFKISHGYKEEGISSVPLIDLSQPKFSKYHRMKKLKMPIKTILNKMKLDGISQQERDVFSGKTANGFQETDPLKLAEQLGLPKKPTIPKPVNQMKRVHWEPVQLQKIKTSIWDNIDHEWFDYDPIMFELNFQTRKRKEKIKTDALKGNVGKESDENKDDQKHNDDNSSVNFVDAKRSQMVQIGLRSFNMTNEQLRDIILTLNEDKIDVGHLSTLIDIVPTPEEQIQAEKASEDREVKYFGIVERFFYSLYDIVELKSRLQKWLFKLQFIERCKELQEQIDIINQGKLTILRSNNLKEIFGIVLAFGNHMNFGNKKGNAYGFRLNGLSLLPQIKTTDNSMTFPMFIWAFIKKKYPKLTHILKEFEPVQKASHS